MSDPVRADLEEFVACYRRLFWLRDESLEDSAYLPEPHVLAQEIADDLRSALAQIEDVLGDLEQRVGAGELEEG